MLRHWGIDFSAQSEIFSSPCDFSNRIIDDGLDRVVKLPQNDAGGKTQWRVSQFFLTEIDRPAPIHLAPQ